MYLYPASIFLVRGEQIIGIINSESETTLGNYVMVEKTNYISDYAETDPLRTRRRGAWRRRFARLLLLP